MYPNHSKRLQNFQIIVSLSECYIMLRWVTHFRSIGVYKNVWHFLPSLPYLYPMRVVLFMFILSLSSLLSAQVFTQYTTDNSELPDNIVTQLLEENDNTLWVGTENGLLRIDASGSWTVFNTGNSGIPGNTIRALYKDMDGNLWVGTQLNGMGKYDGSGWTNYSPDNSGLPEFHIRAFAQSPDGTRWIGTPAGLVRWDGADDWYTYPMSDTGFLYVNITSIHVLSNDSLVMGTINGGIVTLFNDEITHYRTDNSLIGDNTIVDIEPDAEGNIWLATAFGGLCVATADFNFLNFNIFNSDIPDLSVNAIHHTGEYGWLAMDAFGLVQFNGSFWVLWDMDNSAIPSNLLNDVLETDELVYIATDDAGLVLLDRNATDFDQPEPVSVLLFPNPASDWVVVNGLPANSTLTLMDAKGACVLQVSSSGSEMKLDTSALPDGWYLLRCGHIATPLFIQHPNR